MASAGASGRRDKTTNQDPELVGLPPRMFLYTLDQIATILALELKTVRASYIFYEGRDVGIVSRDLMVARNISPVGTLPEWRVAQTELVRWMRRKGFRWIERGYVSH